MVEDQHELALDALMRTIAHYGGVWGDGKDLRALLSPLVGAITDLGSQYSESWDSAWQTLREAAGQASSTES